MTLSIHPLTQKIQLIHPFFLCFSSCCEILPNPKTPVALLKGLSGRTQASSKHLFSGDESSPRCLLEGNKSRIWKNIWKKTGISLKMGGLGPICSPWVSWVLAVHNSPKCLPDWSASDRQCTQNLGPLKVFSPRKKRSYGLLLVITGTLQGTNISHLGKRKIMFTYTLGGDMLVS